MKLYVSKGGKDCGGALILDYPSDCPPSAVRFNGKVYAACPGLRDGAVLYTPADFAAPDESVEVVISDGPVGKSEVTARVEKIDNNDWDDPRR
jgi:hypothetical protein